MFAKYHRWLSQVYDSVQRRVLGKTTTTSRLSALPFSAEVVEYLSRHHGDVQKPVPTSGTEERVLWVPLRHQLFGDPLIPLFQPSQSDINGWVGDMKAGYDAVDLWRAGVTQPLVKQYDYVDGMFDTQEGVFARTIKAVDKRFPALDMNRLAPYLDKNGNLVLKIIPGYDRQAVGWAQLLKAMDAMRVGGGARLGGIKKNLNHNIVGASRDTQPAQSAIDRAGYPAIPLHTGETVDPNTPFLIANGREEQNLGNLEATKLAVLYFKHLVRAGKMTEAQAVR